MASVVHASTRPSASSPAPSARPGSAPSSCRRAPGRRVDQRRAGEAAGRGARRARRRAARRGAAPTERRRPASPRSPRSALEDDAPLEQPIDEEFRVGTMTLGWDADDERVVVEVFPFDDGGRRGAEAPPRRRSRSRSPTRCSSCVLPAGAGPRVQQAGPGRRRRPAGRRARSAAARSTPRATSARAPTATGAPTPSPTQRPAPRRVHPSSRPTTRTAAHRGRARDRAAGSCRPPTRRSSAPRPLDGVTHRRASTSRSAGSGRCGTSPTARWPAARSRPTSCPRRSGWDVVPPTVLRGTARSAPACAGLAGARRRRRGPGRPGADRRQVPGGLPARPRRVRRRTTARCPWSTTTSDAAAPDGGVRRRGQQRRPQGRARAGDARRPPLRRRPRRLLPRRRQAAHRAVGLGAASRSPTRTPPGVRGARPSGCAARTSAADARRSSRAAHRRRGSSRPPAPVRRRCSGRDVMPAPRRGWPSIPWPAF